MPIFLALVAAGALPENHGATWQAVECPPSKVGGSIYVIEPLSRGQSLAKSPRHVPPRGTGRDAKEGDPLCAGERLVNPTGSGAKLEAVLAGGAVLKLAPGQSALIRAPTYLTKVMDAKQRFDRFVGSLAGTLTRPVPDAEFNLPSETFAVTQWGPIRFQWPSGAPAHPVWTVNVRNERGVALSTRQSSNFVELNLGRHCPNGCSLEISGPGMTVHTNIKIVAERDALKPEGIDSLAKDPIARAITGIWLASWRDDIRWKPQGLSLMWSTACTLPAVMLRLREFYPDIDAQSVCVGHISQLPDAVRLESSL